MPSWQVEFNSFVIRQHDEQKKTFTFSPAACEIQTLIKLCMMIEEVHAILASPKHVHIRHSVLLLGGAENLGEMQPLS